MSLPYGLEQIVRSVRPALTVEKTTEEQRMEFISGLVQEIYDYVKYGLHDPSADTAERRRVGRVLEAALNPEDD